MNAYQSWGLYPPAEQKILRQEWLSDELPNENCILPYGQGRSYGDSCLNDGHSLLLTSSLNHFIFFDRKNGVIRCEAGVTIDELLKLIVPCGWFVPVTPGTKFVSIGGAVANDVHGKNHHVAGSFGCHVLAFELLRSDTGRIQCSPQQNGDLFCATIGGLGLTGLITWVEIKLKPIETAYIEQISTRFANLSEFFALSEKYSSSTYTVAWIDCLASEKKLGRGLFFCGEHLKGHARDLRVHSQPRFSVPFFMPEKLLNSWTLNIFNSSYYHKPLAKKKIVHYDPFFYPLDRINNWNRLYGRRGFMQYQCVVPKEVAEKTLSAILRKISAAKTGSFLAVLKMFGDRRSSGILSFPRPGATLALDFQNSGPKIFQLLEELDEIVVHAGGAVYAAKDARMSAKTFRASYPSQDQMVTYLDPNFSSSFWRRVRA